MPFARESDEKSYCVKGSGRCECDMEMKERERKC
jgi:hypothetical protein